MSKTVPQPGPLCKYWELQVQHYYYVNIYSLGASCLESYGVLNTELLRMEMFQGQAYTKTQADIVSLLFILLQA